MQERTKLDGLTAARFYAALMIVCLHVATMPQLHLPTYLQFINRHFSLGVQIFFVISSFSLFFGYLGKMAGPPQVRDFAVRRLFRMGPLFYVMMAVYVAYRYLQYGVGTDWGHIITSATFTFNFFPRYVDGFVWASWTIGIEMAFYCFVPLLIWFITTLGRAAAFFAAAALVGSVWAYFLADVGPGFVLFQEHFFFAHLVYFAAGILAFFVWLRTRQSGVMGKSLLALGLVSIGALFAIRFDLAEQTGWAVVRPLQTIPLMLLVLGMAVAPVAALVNRFTIAMGEASFSLYLFHPLLIGILMNGGFYKWIYRSVPDAGMAYGVCVLATLAILFPAALLGFKYIEVPGNRLGARLIDWLHRRNREALSEDTAIAGR